MAPRRLWIALLTLVVCAAPAYAQDAGGRAPAEVALSSNRFTYHFDVNYMVQASSRQDYPYHDNTFQDGESFIWWRLRPRFAARSRHVDFVVEGQDTHSAGGEFGVRKAWLDLLNAYVDVKEIKGLAFKAGRQQGDLEVIPRMVRTPDFAAVIRSFDVAEASWANRQTDVRAFVFAPVDNLPTQFNKRKPGEVLWTTYARRTLNRRSSIQSYLIARHNREVTSETGARGTGAVYAWEAQAVGPTPMRRLNWAVETVLQRGHYAIDDVRAWGVFLRGDIDLPRSNTLDVRYSVTTGDGNKGDGVRASYDPFYSATSNFGSLGTIRGVNVKSLTIGGTYALSPPLTLFWRYFNTHLYDRRDVWYGAVTPNVSNPQATSSFLGHEMDMMLVYRVRPQLQIRTGFYQFITGGYVSSSAEGQPREFRVQIIGGL